MAAILDFSKFSFGVEEIRAVKELVYDEIIESPEISLLCTIYPGIVYDKEIGFIGKGGLVGVAHQGCNPAKQDWNIGTRVVKWEPKAWEILLVQCANDLEATAAVYSRRNGIEMYDFTSTDYINIVVEVLAQSIKEFIIRVVWFSNTTAENVTDGGQITDGVDVKYFTLINGLFRQMEVQYTSNPSQRVAIAENAAATAAEQALLPANIQGYLQSIVFGASMILRQQSNGVILCTQSFYDAYAKSLQGIALESMLTNLTDGIKTLSFNGVPLFPIPIWDVIIASYFNTGTKLVNPHRAVYTTKDALAVGVDAEGSFGDVEVWYNRDTREVKIESMGKVDAKILNPELFQIAI